LVNQPEPFLTVKRIKLKDLARELGLTSRELLDRCRAEGLSVQNSITKLRIEQERLVRSWFAPDAENPSEVSAG